MKNTLEQSIITATFLVVLLFSITFIAQAQNNDPLSNINYPIKELGNCESQKDCMSFCSKSENMTACISFAEKQNLLSAKDLEISKKVAKRMSENKMPGNCTDQASCENYCKNNPENIKECVAVAEELGVLSSEELTQAKKVAKALEDGATLPGGCTGKDSCESYCADGSHIDECLIFAEKAQILPEDQIAEAKKVAQFIKSGETPGGCKDRASCKSYCDSDENFTECLGFAEKAGLISKDDAELAKKVGGKGPGGCKSKTECEAYCADETHGDECIEFGLKTGAISEEEQKNIKEGVQKIKDGLEKIPADAKADVESCIKGKIGADKYEAMMTSNKITSKTVGEAVGACFESVMKNYSQKAMKGGAEQIMNSKMPIKPEGVSEDLIPSIPKGENQDINKIIENSSLQNVPDLCSGKSWPPSCEMVGNPQGIELCKKCKGE